MAPELPAGDTYPVRTRLTADLIAGVLLVAFVPWFALLLPRLLHLVH